MTSTFVIDANRSISKATDTNKLQWTNTLGGGLQLLKGDKISMATAQINQRGANVNTIDLENDINEIIYFVYYIIDNESLFAGIKTKKSMYRDGKARPAGMETSKIGYTNTPYYYWGDDSSDLILQRGQVNIQIKAGSYSPNNIATIISEAFAGRFVGGKTPFDYIRDDGLRGNVRYPGLCVTNDEAMIMINPNDEPPATLDADGPMFCQIPTTDLMITEKKNNGTTITKTAMNAHDQHWISTQSFADTTAETWYSVNANQFLGAVPMLNWDAEKSRFTITNLHAPYRVPNYPDPTSDKESENRGEEATVFNRETIEFGVYPKSAIGGIAVTNPAWQFCLDNSTIAQALQAKTTGSTAEKNEAKIKITTFKFTDYWADETEALAQWKGTIWSRLGFEMTQFTDDDQWLDFFPIGDIAYNDGAYSLKPGVDKPKKMIGLTTTQEITTDMAMTSGGLGSAHSGEDGQGFKNQGYSYEVPGYTINTNSNPGGSVAPAETYEMLTSTLPLTARHLPRLSDTPYYNIWTSILDSSNWYTNKGHRDTLIGQCNKNYVAADFLYQYSQGINFTILEDKVITEVKTSVLLPDGTSPDPELFDDNCSVLYHITRPARQQPILPVKKKETK